jgi:hypothetical protein
MIATDTFTHFGRRMAATQGCPYIMIAQTLNPIRQLEESAMRERVEAMIQTIIDGLTLPPAEIERRLKDIAREQIRPEGIVRSATAI